MQSLHPGEGMAAVKDRLDLIRIHAELASIAQSKQDTHLLFQSLGGVGDQRPLGQRFGGVGNTAAKAFHDIVHILRILVDAGEHHLVHADAAALTDAELAG